MSERKEIILGTLKSIHQTYRIKTVTGVSEHTKSAQTITKTWQDEVKENNEFKNKNTIKIEAKVKGENNTNKDNNEKIDLVDLKEKTAYELKVSGKNCHHEFYKDLIKVITYNIYQKENQKLEKLIFISESFGIEKLKGRLDKKLLYEMKCKHNITIELIPI
ncbi:MAG: hypothetical protein K0B10_06765 [Vicingaceae bacterium]|nr:hypothetical protein [Vicingaceae bacterium]